MRASTAIQRLSGAVRSRRQTGAPACMPSRASAAVTRARAAAADAVRQQRLSTAVAGGAASRSAVRPPGATAGSPLSRLVVWSITTGAGTPVRRSAAPSPTAWAGNLASCSAGRSSSASAGSPASRSAFRSSSINGGNPASRSAGVKLGNGTKYSTMPLANHTRNSKASATPSHLWTNSSACFMVRTWYGLSTAPSADRPAASARRRCRTRHSRGRPGS